MHLRVLILTLFLMFTAPLALANFNKLVIFGDSLSDTGNLYRFTNQQYPSSPPYFQGRFSNGLVWPDYLMGHYLPALTIENYAYGGAVVTPPEEVEAIGLSREFKEYFQLHTNGADPLSLYLVWIGANNYLFSSPEVSNPNLVHQINQNISARLEQLANAGAKYILVLNLPDLSASPYAIATGNTDYFHDLSLRHNQELSQNLSQLALSYPHVHWYEYSVQALMEQIKNDPHAYGFDNLDQSCIGQLCDGYLFFDEVHPTTQAHVLIAEKLANLIKKIQS